MPRNQQLEPLARRIAREQGIDPDLFVRLVTQESGFDPRAVSQAGAQGLTQLMPATARGLGVSDPFDPEQNLSGGARFLRSMLDRYGGDYRLALAAYNAGPGNVDKYGGVPPFAETQHYVNVLWDQAPPSGRVPGLASVAPQEEARMTAEEILAKLEEAKGTAISVRPRDPRVTTRTQTPRLDWAGDPVPGQTTTRATQGPNPAPVYRHAYKDGTYVDIKAPPTNPDGTRQGEYEVIGGTALTSLAREEAAAGRAATAPPRTITVGGRSYTWDAASGQYHETPGVTQPAARPAPAPRIVMVGGKPYTVESVPDADPARPPTTHLTPVEGPAASAAKPGKVFTVGRTIFRENDDGTVTRVDTVAADAPYRSPQQAARDEVDLAAARRNLLPDQQRILQAHHDTVEYIRGMWERGEIDPGQADAYVKLSLQAAEAGLRGTTPFQEMDAARKAEIDRQRMGMDILNQRVSSGSTLASSLMSSAMGPHVMLRPGQTSLGIDPLASVVPLLEQLGGGPEVTPFAKGLLTGGQQAAPPGPPAARPAGL